MALAAKKRYIKTVTSSIDVIQKCNEYNTYKKGGFMSQKIVARFPKNALEEVRAQVINYKGYDLIDIRVWAHSKDGSEDIATKKGLSLSVELLPKLKKAILALEKVIKITN